MGNSCGCCLSTSPATPHPHIPPPHPPPSPPPSPPPPPSLESVIHSISQSIGNENPTQKIGLLIQFIDDMLLKIKAPSQHGASTSSSGIQLDSVAWGTKAASEIIDTISREAKELEKSEVAKELGNVALKAVKLVGESHWIFLGLSMAAYALERCVTVRSNVSEVNELLEKIVDLAKDVKKLGETTPRDISERLCSAVHIIVEGTILCCEYTDQGKLQRYWLAAAMQTQLEKTGKSIQDITSSLTLSTVADIKKQLPWRIEQSPQNLLDFKPEGIEEKVAKVREIVDLEGSEATVAVILWGFGGVGKSILALSCIQELNCISKGYKFCRVIIDEKTPDRSSHIKQLQKDIINDFGGGKLDLRNTEEGRHQVFKVVMSKRCLLFIDNVVDSWYIKELLPSDFPQSEENNVSVQVAKEARLRIVITSRQNNIKQLLNIKKFNEYHVDPLSYPAAKIILRKTILGGQGESHLKGDFDEEGCINAIAEACKGVPLLLSVFGNCLRAETERDQTFYKEALKALTEADFDRFADEENLSEKLMFVYDKMRDPEAKEAFLDICTQFHGWRWIHVAEIVDSNNLESLHKRGLVKRDESGKVIVHDILRLMGSKAAKETRITNHREFLAVVEEEYKLKNIKGVALTDNTSLATIESAHLNAMRHSLRVLILGDWVVINGLCHGAFTNLRYLSVGDVTAFPFTGVFKMEKLKRFYNKSKPGMDLPELPRSLRGIVYEVPHSGCEFAAVPLENMKTLESFEVQSSKPVKLPEGFKLPASVERLTLTRCRKLPETFSHLTNVEFLDLSNCHFESLPQGFGRLASLKYLYMKYCPSLKYLSEGFGSLCSLTELSVEGCTRLENLSAHFGRLTALQKLWMGECESLRTLPEDFGGLSSLQYLDIRGCIGLERLPESFSRLSINSLDLETLPSLDELPQSIGNMPSLTRLVIKSCNSLTTLPNSLVQLKMLKNLTIDSCNKLAALPKDFGHLTSLTHMTVDNCPALKELPDGFHALRVLKILELKRCKNLVNLSPDLGQLNCLEELYILRLPLSSLPKGFSNLKSLRKLAIVTGFKLETLPDDIENLVSLRRLTLCLCPILDGITMERIVKLQNCSYVDIGSSPKLMQRWEDMQNKEEYPIVVWTKSLKREVDLDWQRATRVALFSLNCKELNGTGDELIDRSSIVINVDTTVAVISLPFHLQSHHEVPLKNMCELARRRSTTACSGQLQVIICLKGFELEGQRVSAEKEEESIEKALKWLPEGSCAIPVSDIRRRFLVKDVFFEYYSEESGPACFIADVRVQSNGQTVFVDGERMGKDDASEKLKQNFHKSKSEEEENESPDELQECLKLLCNNEEGESERSIQSPQLAEINMLKMFAQALKKKGIHHFLDRNMEEVHINQLEGKDVCFIICDLSTLEHTKIQQFCKDLQSFNCEGVLIVLSSNEKHGIGTYMRTCGYMSLAALLNPVITQGIKEANTNFILVNREGKIISRAPLSLVMSWDIKAYPFGKFEVGKIISKLHDKSTLEFLLEDMDILDHEGSKVEKQFINNKLILLYAEPPTHEFKMKNGLDQLLQEHKDFKILYIGHFSNTQQTNIEAYKTIYEDATQKMHWLKLSFWDMLKFWYRCSYLSGNFIEKLNFSFTLPNLVKQLYVEKRWLLFLDSDGVVARSGKEVVDIICQSSDENRDDIDIMVKDELIKSSLESGKCSRIVQTYFTTDEIYNHPEHSHTLVFTILYQYYTCDICCSTFKASSPVDQGWYFCSECDWGACQDCWKRYARKKVQSMLEM